MAYNTDIAQAAIADVMIDAMNGFSVPNEPVLGERMPDRHTRAKTRLEEINEWGRRTARELSDQLRGTGWEIKWVDWSDCSRVAGSCWGSNITDYILQMKVEGIWTSCFTLASNNMDPTVVVMSAKKLWCVWRDPETGESHPMTVFDLCKNAQKHFGHAIDTPDLTDGNDDMQVTYKVQASFVGLPKGEKAQMRMTGRCHQASVGAAKNMCITMTPQESNISLDNIDPGLGCTPMYFNEVDAKTGEERAYTAEFSCDHLRNPKQQGQQTDEQAAKAVAERTSCEVYLGPEGAPKSTSVLTMQIPMKPRILRGAPPAKKHKGTTPPDSPALKVEDLPCLDGEEPFDCYTSLSADAPESTPLVYTSLSADAQPAESGLAYRSLGSDAEGQVDLSALSEALPEQLPSNLHIRLGAWSKGEDAGKAREMLTRDAVRSYEDGEITAVQMWPLWCAPGAKIGLEDVAAVLEMLQVNMRAGVASGGVATNLMSDVAAKLGLTTTKLSDEGAAGIAATAQFVPTHTPAMGQVPKGLFASSN